MCGFISAINALNQLSKRIDSVQVKYQLKVGVSHGSFKSRNFKISKQICLISVRLKSASYFFLYFTKAQILIVIMSTQILYISFSSDKKIKSRSAHHRGPLGLKKTGGAQILYRGPCPLLNKETVALNLFMVIFIGRYCERSAYHQQPHDMIQCHATIYVSQYRSIFSTNITCFLYIE